MPRRPDRGKGGRLAEGTRHGIEGGAHTVKSRVPAPPVHHGIGIESSAAGRGGLGELLEIGSRMDSENRLERCGRTLPKRRRGHGLDPIPNRLEASRRLRMARPRIVLEADRVGEDRAETHGGRGRYFAGFRRLGRTIKPAFGTIPASPTVVSPSAISAPRNFTR